MLLHYRLVDGAVDEFCGELVPSSFAGDLFPPLPTRNVSDSVYHWSTFGGFTGMFLRVFTFVHGLETQPAPI